MQPVKTVSTSSRGEAGLLKAIEQVESVSARDFSIPAPLPTPRGIRTRADYRLRKTPAEVDEVLANPSSRVVENPNPTSGRPAIFGHTRAGRPLLIAYDVLDEEKMSREESIQ